MHKIARISVIAMLLACTSVYANILDNPDDPNMPLQGYKYRWSLGFDVDTQIMHPQNDTQYLAYNYRLGSAIYAAWRSRGPFGLEFGYHWTTAKPKNIDTVPGTSIFGATAQTTALYQCKLRVDDTYLDAYWHYKVKKIAELKLGVGVGFVREGLEFYNAVGQTDPVAVALTNLYTVTTMVARFNIGVQTMLTKRIGARALFNYQTTSSVKMHNTLEGVNPGMFANSYMVSLGLFYTITGYYNDNPGPNGEFIN